jgi:hypothetical protein
LCPEVWDWAALEDDQEEKVGSIDHDKDHDSPDCPDLRLVGADAHQEHADASFENNGRGSVTNFCCPPPLNDISYWWNETL